ncbi:uncharacterized protein LOC131952722 [Physella acuta]|uniref:uncharacterized protein LOC131952722 n=1 Tax=Physella acuta TaxID=109671 RepID=UPI0027DDF06B|nr:uncharacterized protein LOC131952722 [Physella acuta]XP_059171506.1 uncharacterized protein LOC131952722 [Physella acuta]XP_059171507.1 uncharacterized protein LOC131952722 [Physella acuta]
MLTICLLVHLTLGLVTAEDTGCNFDYEGCTYNIYLSPKDQANMGGRDCGVRDQQLLFDRAQNDYSAKLDDMEKNFSFLRDEHEQRIKELESTVRELLGLDKIRERGKDDTGQSPLGPLSLDNAELMEKLENEFNKLRKEIREKSDELLDTKIRLNETSTKVQEVQLSQFQTSQDLLNAENQITMLLRERAILKNQLKDRSYKLEVSGQKAAECENKNVNQQEEMMKLFRSENTLKEELMTAQLKLNITKAEHEQLEAKHNDLKAKHERTKFILKIREKELIDCYQAKTSTFCGFEDPKLCGFTNINDTTDYFDWERIQGTTPSGKTGPSKDHTCDGPTGHFMYIEASAKGKGNNAILYSPLYRGMVEQCVEFFYHMYGKHIGTLNVYAQARGDVLRSVWRAYGNQGDVWTNAKLAIPQELAMAGYQIAFEGITESGYQGDMAIDDVSVTDGPCPLDQRVTPVKVSINSTSVASEGKIFARKIRKKTKKESKPKPAQ